MRRVIAIGVPVLLILFTLFVAVRCSGRDDRADRAAQVQFEADTAEAIQNAATGAVATFENRTATEKDIDHAAAEATGRVDQSKDADAVRAAVLDGVCRATAHRNDPACRVR